jgi:pimeloyl-ACP methyl ester carboxylesterase
MASLTDPAATTGNTGAVRRLLAFALILSVVIVVGGARSALPAAAAPSVTWSGCGSSFQCATLTVPRDYGNPSGATIGLALIKAPARNQAQRIGSLLVNPGGPGASGVDFARALAGVLPSSIRDRFDIIGFDPRGIGGSGGIVCHDNLQALIAVDPSPDSQAEWDAAAKQDTIFADACEAKYGDAYLSSVGTKNVARDMDQIRQAVGDTKLTYLGFSYGTVIGQVYAGLFPQNVRAMVLDGAVDIGLSDKEQVLEQAEGFEQAMNAFIADCRQTKCVLTQKGDPGTLVDGLIKQVEQAPIPSRTADRPLGPGELVYALAEPLYSESSWPQLAKAINSALSGDGSAMVQLTDQYLGRNGDGSYGSLTEDNIAVNCVDTPTPDLPQTYAQYVASLPEWTARAPRFGAGFASGLTCSTWPATPDPLQATNAAGAPPIVVVSTSGDPATPYAWGVAVAKRLQSGVLVSYGGEGHTAFLGGDSCVDNAVTTYLVSLTVPANNTVCGDAAKVAAAAGADASPTPSATSSPAPSGTAAPSATATPSPTNSATVPAAPGPQSPTVGAPATGGGTDAGSNSPWRTVIVLIVAAGVVAAGFGVVAYVRR